MKFLGVAAAGDWELAAAIACDELPWREWDPASLRGFVAALAPGEARDARHIATDLAPLGEAGLLNAEACVRAPLDWHWLVLRAQGDRVAAVEALKSSVKWPGCTVERLDRLLCLLTHRLEDEGRQAAAALYRHVLCRTFTSHDMNGALAALLEETPVALTSHAYVREYDETAGDGGHHETPGNPDGGQPPGAGEALAGHPHEHTRVRDAYAARPATHRTAGQDEVPSRAAEAAVE
ncbi:hypothetical protein [Streptomyces sp. NPDC051014]|uniref:hypothetical protein n=1 Tax=Streptomyces sp. NPDC051014 TaxID=3155751 RepID=UPI003409EC1E